MGQKLNIKNIGAIELQNPLLAEALKSIAEQVGHVADQTASTLHGNTPAPPPLASLTVSAAGGIFDGAITDNGPAQRGINYFVEYSASGSFAQPTVVDLGQSRNFRLNLGNQTLAWRAYHGYPTGPRSDPVYHGTQANPTMVSGGGSTTGPTLTASQGSGTTIGANGGDGGFGLNPTREAVPRL